MTQNIQRFNFPAVHPGLVLQDELDEIGVTQTELASYIVVLPKTIAVNKSIKRDKLIGGKHICFLFFLCSRFIFGIYLLIAI